MGRASKVFAGDTENVALEVSNPLLMTASKPLQPELQATLGPDLKPGAKPFTSGHEQGVNRMEGKVRKHDGTVLEKR